MRQADIIRQTERYGAQNYAPLEVVITRGEGAFLFDLAGRRYFDFLSAYSAVGQGHCHPRIVGALVEQARRVTLTSRAMHNDRLGAMLEKIARLSGFEKVLPMNTGAEAVETAIKAMRRYGYREKRIPADQAEIVVAEGNFHGRTTTIVGFSDEPAHHLDFGPPTPGFRLVPFGDLGALQAALGPRTAGVLLEPIQGEGGVRIPPPGYLAGVREACTRANVLLAWDEIQTGLGRTGRMFAFEHEGARPDLLILGKALSGGVYPVSAVAADDRVMRVFEPGSHGSTFGGNPLAAAVSVAALDVLIDEDLAPRSARLGERALARLRAGLAASPAVREVRGRGLMLAVELREPVAHEACRALLAAGVLAKDTRGNVVRLSPPLVIAEDDLDAALEIIVRTLAHGPGGWKRG